MSLDPENFVQIQGLDDAGHYFCCIGDDPGQGGDFGWGKSLAPGQSAEGYITTSTFSQDPTAANEVIVMLTISGASYSSDTAMFFAERRDVTADKDAIREVLRSHRDVVIEAIKSGDPGLLAKVYVDPSQPMGLLIPPSRVIPTPTPTHFTITTPIGPLSTPSPLQIAFCSEYGSTYYQSVYKTVDVNILTWNFLTESSAVVKVEETIEEWKVTCPSRNDWQLYDTPGRRTVCYYLEKQDGTWRIASCSSEPCW